MLLNVVKLALVVVVCAVCWPVAAEQSIMTTYVKAMAEISDLYIHWLVGVDVCCRNA